jgi:hypothetical protein
VDGRLRGCARLRGAGRGGQAGYFAARRFAIS